MNLRQLEHFLALADLGSFAQAAAKVHLSQPALTRSIQSLEQTLDMPLCDRHARGITLTPGGVVVAERARRVLLEAKALARDVALYKNHELGDVSFGAGPYPASFMLADTIALLVHAFPHLSVRTEVGNWTVLLQRLQREEIDFFVVDRRSILASPELATEVMSSHPCGWFARPSHPVFAQVRPTRAILRKLQLASVPLPLHMREDMRRALRFKPGDMLNFTVECNSVFNLKQLAEQSDIVIYGPLAVMRRELADGSLRRIEFADSAGFTMQFAIVSLANRTASPPAQRAMEAWVECDRRLGGD